MYRRVWTTVLGVTLLLLLAAAHAQGQAPVVLKVTPNEVTAGSQNVELKIQGVNFLPGTKVSFSGFGIAWTPTRIISTEIRVTIGVARNAPHTARDITVTNSAGSDTGKGMLKIIPPLPVIQSFTPTHAKQGDSFLLVITGSNFFSGAKVKIVEPLSGKVDPRIQVLSTTVVSPSKIQAEIKIAANVPPVSRLVQVWVAGKVAVAAGTPFKVIAPAR